MYGLDQHLRCPQHADSLPHLAKGKCHLHREEAEVNLRLGGPVLSLIIPGKEPGQEVSRTLGHLQRRRPEC